MKEKIMNAFRVLGFQLRELDDIGFGFEYEEINYIWMPNDEDPNFLYIGIPAVMSMPEYNQMSFYKLLDNANANIKYIKVNTLADYVWLFNERALFDEDEDKLKDIITQMIYQLEAGLVFFTRIKSQVLKEEEE